MTIVSWNTRELLAACLRSLAAASRRRVEVHVVENASTDGSGELVAAEFPDVRLIRNPRNVGFARACNQSWADAKGRYWLLLNSDTEVRPGALDRLIEFMDARPRAGLATAKLLNADGTPQFCAQPNPAVWRVLLEAGRLHKWLPSDLQRRLLLSSYWSYDRPCRLGWTWGTALIARREAVEQVGPLSESFYMYGEDLEWSLRMRKAGWEIWFCPDAEVIHYGGRSAAVQWQEVERGRRVTDGYYQALEQHHGRFWIRAYQAATLLALGSQWLTLRLRGRSPLPGLQPAINDHLARLTRRSAVSS